MAPSSEQTQTPNGNGSETTSRIGSLRKLASALVSRFDFARHAGVTYNGRRDVYCVLGYPEELRVQDYRDRYRRGGVAKRIVQAFPKATWTKGVSIQDDPDPETTTPFEEAVDELFTRLDAWTRLQRADRLASLGHYGALLIGAPGELEEPLPAQFSSDEVLYLTPLAEDRAEIDAFEIDPESPRFGLPTRYKVRLGTVEGTALASNVTTLARSVHWTRIIHVVEEPEEDEVLGEPVLRAVWNYLEDLDKLVGGGSEAAWRNMDRGLHFDLDPDADLTPEEVQAMRDQVDEYVHNLSRIVTTTGGNLTPLGTTTASFGPNAGSVLDLVSATTGIPKRILLGSERGELASTQDRRNWHERIAERRDDFAVPLVRALVERFLEHGVLPEPRDGDFQVVWPEIEALDEGEKAEVADKLASANQKQFAAEGSVIITSEEIRDTVFGLEPLEEFGGGDDGEEPIEQDGERMVVDPDTGELVAESRAAQDADFVEVEPDEPEWRAVHRAADKNFGRLMSIVFAVSTAMSAQLGAGQALANAASIRSQSMAMQPVRRVAEDVREEFQPVLESALLRTLVDGGEATLANAERRGSLLRTAQLGVTFNAENERAVQWARENAAELITEINAETLEAVREVIIAGFRQGLTGPQIARRVRSIVGLHSRQVQAVANLEAELLEAEGGELITRFDPQPTLRQLPGLRVRVPQGGLSGDAISRILDRYTRMLHNLRARTIARTETIRAANEGQLELWRQAQEQGQLGLDEARVWIVTPDDALCPICKALDGSIAFLRDRPPGGQALPTGQDEPDIVPDSGTTQLQFDPRMPEGFTAAQEIPEPDLTDDRPTEFPGGLTGPPAHPNCRCATGIASAEDIATWRQKLERERTASDEAPPEEQQPSAENLERSMRALYDDVDPDPDNFRQERVRWKREIQQDIARRMIDKDDRFGFVEAEVQGLESDVQDLIDQWAGTSAGNNRALGMQLSAQNEFALGNAHLEHFTGAEMVGAQGVLMELTQFGMSRDEFNRLFLRSMYESTQEFFQQRGITHITLLRGAEYAQDVASGSGIIGLQPMSSFSVDINTPVDFGRTIHVVHVPVEQVIGTFRTGYGAAPEAEVVLLGGDYEAFTINRELDAPLAEAQTDLLRALTALLGGQPPNLLQIIAGAA